MKKHIIISLIIIISGGLLLIFGIKGCSKVKENIQRHFSEANKNDSIARTEELPTTHIVPPDYDLLIKPKYKDKLRLLNVQNSKVRNPLVTFKFDERYHIIIYKIGVVENIPFLKLLNIMSTFSKMEVGYDYGGITTSLLTWQIRQGKVENTDHILFTYSSEKLNAEIKNDTAAAYYLETDNASLQYQNNRNGEVHIEGVKSMIGHTFVKMNILFLKRDNAIYFITMIDDSNNNMEPGMLVKLVL